MLKRLFQRSIKIQTLLLCGFIAAILAASLIFFTRDFWRQQWRAWLLGTVDVAIEEFVYLLPEADRIRVVQLGVSSAQNSGADTNAFSFDGHTWNPIKQEIMIGTNAEALAKDWRKLNCSYFMASLCHEPAYGLEFFSKGQCVFRTTFCWKCSDFYVPTPMGQVLVGFDEKSKSALIFWNHLQAVLPLPLDSKTNFSAEGKSH